MADIRDANPRDGEFSLWRTFAIAGHYRPFSFPPHPMSAFALPVESKPCEICVNICKKTWKKHPLDYRP